jgi:hypothetical protein
MKYKVAAAPELVGERGERPCHLLLIDPAEQLLRGSDGPRVGKQRTVELLQGDVTLHRATLAVPVR